MDNVHYHLSELISNNSTEKHVKELYKTLATLQLSEEETSIFIDILLPKLGVLINNGMLDKVSVYLSLLANPDTNIIRHFCEFQKVYFKLDITDPNSIFNYTVYTKQHWFANIILNTSYDPNFSQDIVSFIKVLRLIYYSNGSVVNIETIKGLLDTLEKSDLQDKFVAYYIRELRQVIKVVTFIKPKLARNKNTSLSKIYHSATSQSALETFSDYLDLSDTDISEQILLELKDEHIFTAYSILLNLIKSLKRCKEGLNAKEDSISSTIKETKLRLLNLLDPPQQLELLENVFVLLFLQNRHLNGTNTDSEEFYCHENEVRLILLFLKSVCEELRLKNEFKKNSACYGRFVDLNKKVIDGLWRLELIMGVESEKCSKNIVRYLLAPPESLIHLCLKRDDFEKAHQVLQIFNLQYSEIAPQIQYAEKLLTLKSALTKVLKIASIKKKNPKLQNPEDVSVSTLVETFFTSNPPTPDDQNANFMNLLDIAITLPDSYEGCEELLNLAVTYNVADSNESSLYESFCKRMLETFTAVNTKYTLPLRDILCSPLYDFDKDNFLKQEEFVNIVSALYIEFNNELNAEKVVGKFNKNHATHKLYMKLNSLCYANSRRDDSQESINYLLRFFKYLKAFLKVLFIEGDRTNLISHGQNAAYFDLLNHSRSDIISKLLLAKKLDVTDFERLFAKMKLDLVHHIASIYFPVINLYISPRLEKFVTANIPTTYIVSHIRRKNWLLSFIMSNIYSMQNTSVNSEEIRTKTLNNFFNLPRMQNLKVMFGENNVIAALQYQIPPATLKDYLEENIVVHTTDDMEKSNSMLISQESVESLETGEEIFEEDNLKNTDWKRLFEVIDSVSQVDLCKSQELLDLRDMVLGNLVNDGFEFEYYKYVKYIKHRQFRCHTILENFTTWPGWFCVDVMKRELSSFEGAGDEYVFKFTEWHKKIEVYESIAKLYPGNSWFEVMMVCQNVPQEVLQTLLNTVEVNLLLQFIEIHEPNEALLTTIDMLYFIALFDSNTPLATIRDLLMRLPLDHSVATCHSLIKALKKLDHLLFLADFLTTIQGDDNAAVSGIKIFMNILSCFSPVEQEHLWCLIDSSLNIIEMLLMNTKLEKLGQVLEKIKPIIENCEYDECQISCDKIDELLRIYAERSLEFRVTPPCTTSRSPEQTKLLLSLDSINVPGRSSFVIPDNVPSKQEWIENSEVVECMCCQESTFSMFNRRHHCRRCGRVVCRNCSSKRMQVPTYGDILVRVCKDCYAQSHPDGAGTSIRSEQSTRSDGYDLWLLNDNEEHNRIVREEFSYEHAPSVSLAFAILKHHSKNEEYPKFLLKQCDNMLQLLFPVSLDTLKEIDYLLVIKMLKSFAVVAKMLSSDCMLQWGSSLADRILSQAELLRLLAERGCLNMITSLSPSWGRYIDAPTLRRVRDKLLEGEQWSLALEISTKAGLDTSSVFAAWGKSCLRAGSLYMSREKFRRCFEKTSIYETSSELSESFSSPYSSKLRRKPSLDSAENKPLANPPLLNEIVGILETTRDIIDTRILNDVRNLRPISSSTWSLNSSVNIPMQSDPAVCILNRLKRLSSIAAGNYGVVLPEICEAEDHHHKSHLEPLFYEECVYYLKRYGSHMELLKFYIKHEDVLSALKYILENRLSPDVFSEIYMTCLSENMTMELHQGLSLMDPTLDIWKDHLRYLCRHLEKQSMLHSLYQLQQYMADYIRASLTCIKFYKEDASSYSTLTSRVDYLYKAQEHLQQELEQEQWVEVASLSKSVSSFEDTFEAKSLSTPSVVMKMSSKDIDRHINTISRQIEVAKFLADCEITGQSVAEILPDLIPSGEESVVELAEGQVQLPTLFGTYQERVQLAVLAIVCGKNVEDGFGIAFRILQDFKLSPAKIYCQAGKLMAKSERYSGIAQLVSCIKSSGVSDSTVTDMCDEMLTHAIQTLTKCNTGGAPLDGLIKLITNRSSKISAYIETKQLKSAFLLAVKHKRMGDIRRIMREAEFLNQPNIKALCQKTLQTHCQSQPHLKD